MSSPRLSWLSDTMRWRRKRSASNESLSFTSIGHHVAQVAKKRKTDSKSSRGILLLSSRRMCPWRSGSTSAIFTYAGRVSAYLSTALARASKSEKIVDIVIVVARVSVFIGPTWVNPGAARRQPAWAGGSRIDPPNVPGIRFKHHQKPGFSCAHPKPGRPITNLAPAPSNTP